MLDKDIVLRCLPRKIQETYVDVQETYVGQLAS